MAAKKYADDYENVTATDIKGRERKEAVYRGEYYTVNLDAEEIKPFQRKSLIITAGILILHLLGGFIGNRGMYQFYVSLPYVFAFLPLYFMFSGALRIPKEKRRYHRDETSTSYNHMKTAGTALLALLLIAVIGEGVFLLIHRNTGIAQLEYYFLGVEAIAAALALLFFQLQKTIVIEKEPAAQEEAEKQG